MPRRHAASIELAIDAAAMIHAAADAARCVIRAFR